VTTTSTTAPAASTVPTIGVTSPPTQH
jgi:hypothetical protein